MRPTYETQLLSSFQSIPIIVRDLSSNNYLLRKKAREQLVEIGEPSLHSLIELTENEDETVRWEAILTIVQIGSMATLEILLKALEDDEFSIRWLAAEGLVNLGIYALEPLLQELLNKPDSTFLRRGAHHVLRELRKKGIYKDEYALLESLTNQFDHSNIPIKAQKTINSVRPT